MKRWEFYKYNILKYLDKNSHILVIGSSIKEVDLFYKLKYKNVSFGYYNEDLINEVKNLPYYKLYKYLKIDCRKINLPDNNFDYVITHATIHHIDLPHLAIIEMYRVSKIGTLILESNDSLIMRLAVRFGFTEDFEVSSTINKDKDNTSGGLIETGVPNYIYRWSEREIIKLINSYKPYITHDIKFLYANDLSNSAISLKFLKKILKKIFSIFLAIFFLFFKKQQNLLSIYINKSGSNKSI